VDDRNSAEALRKAQIAIRSEQLDVLDEGEFYWRDLMGCRVVNLAGEDLGRVSKLMETGANDVLVLSIDAQAVPLLNTKGIPLRERLVPYIPKQVVRDVDLTGKVIRVDWPSDF
jgi:16S rRNA processing protein RimM